MRWKNHCKTYRDPACCSMYFIQYFVDFILTRILLGKMFVDKRHPVDMMNYFNISNNSTIASLCVRFIPFYKSKNGQINK